LHLHASFLCRRSPPVCHRSCTVHYHAPPCTALPTMHTARCTAELRPTDTLLDLYCGTGSIGLTLAARCRWLYGVELSAAAVRDARKNAERNGVTNAAFLQVGSGGRWGWLRGAGGAVGGSCGACYLPAVGRAACWCGHDKVTLSDDVCDASKPAACLPLPSCLRYRDVCCCASITVRLSTARLTAACHATHRLLRL